MSLGAVGLLLVLAGSTIGGASCARTIGAAPASRSFPPATRAKLQGIVNQYLSTSKAPGLLVGIWSPHGTWLTATGSSNLATGAPLSTDVQYKIASQTKPFTADLILQLVGEGKMSLRDHIDKWVPGVPNGNQITIRELLNNTSGLNDVAVLSNPDILIPSSAAHAKLLAGCTAAELLSSPLAPVAPPGQKWVYSNYGYDLLGRVAELVSHESLSTLIHQRIAVPLHLSHTYLPTSGSGLTTPYMHGYLGDPAQPSAPPADVSSLPGSCVWAAGGMVSTLSDMRKWSVALGTGELLKPSVWAEAQRDQVPSTLAHSKGFGLTRGQITYGLGFFETGGFLGHQGNLLGYTSATYYSPTLHTTVAVADNGSFSPVSATGLAQELAMTALGSAVDFGLDPGQGIAPLSPRDLDQVAQPDGL